MGNATGWMVIGTLVMMSVAFGSRADAEKNLEYRVDCTCKQRNAKNKTPCTGIATSPGYGHKNGGFSAQPDAPAKRLTSLGEGACYKLLRPNCPRTSCDVSVAADTLSGPMPDDVSPLTDTTKAVVKADCGTSTTKVQSPLNKPEALKIYEINGTNFRFETDGTARTIRVTGTLDPAVHKARLANKKACVRKASQQKGVGKLGTSAPDDEADAGHLIATQFGGPGERVNLVALVVLQNNNEKKPKNSPTTFKDLETRWRTAFDAGKKIDVDIRVSYLRSSVDASQTNRPENLAIPYLLTVTSTIQGEAEVQLDFMNANKPPK